MDLNTFLSSGKYLPKPLRDFHDAKEVFKTMHTLVDTSKNEYASDITWIKGQCYVIDIFLWFMAKRGWTMQRSRVKLEFNNLDEEIKARRDADAEVFKKMIQERTAKSDTT